MLPSDDWSRTILSWLHGGVIETATLADDAAPDTIAAALACKDLE